MWKVCLLCSKEVRVKEMIIYDCVNNIYTPPIPPLFSAHTLWAVLVDNTARIAGLLAMLLR